MEPIGFYNKVCEMLDEKLKIIDHDLANIEEDVKRDLEKLEAYFAEVAKVAKTKENGGIYAGIHEWFVSHKNGHKHILMASRKASLEKVKQQLCSLRNKVDTLLQP